MLSPSRMDLLQEIYTENTLKNTERLQLNKLVLRIFSENGTPEEKEVLQSTSSDKSATYIKIFQRAMRVEVTGSIADRAEFKKNLSKLLWTYEKPGEARNYTIPFPHFQPPRTKEQLDTLLSSIYPFACKFSPERIDADSHGTPYKNKKHKLESVDTSSSFFDCLVHGFLTSMSKCYRQLSNNQRKAFAYYFRRMICPRYISISDLTHTELYKERATLSIEPSDYEDNAACDALLQKMRRGEFIKDADRDTKSLVESALLGKQEVLKNNLLARNFIKEMSFLEDRHISLLSDAFNINVILITNIHGTISISTYTQISGSTHSILLYNPGDGHFRGVRRTTDSKFYFDNEDVQLLQFVAEESEKTTIHSHARCDYVEGEVVLHNGVEKTITSISYGEPDAEGIRTCTHVQLNNEKEPGRYGGLRTKDTPIGEIQKKTSPPPSGGKRATRKQRRIFLKT